jgi:hypothetical protein
MKNYTKQRSNSEFSSNDTSSIKTSFETRRESMQSGKSIYTIQELKRQRREYYLSRVVDLSWEVASCLAAWYIAYHCSVWTIRLLRGGL